MQIELVWHASLKEKPKQNKKPHSEFPEASLELTVLYTYLFYPVVKIKIKWERQL